MSEMAHQSLPIIDDPLNEGSDVKEKLFKEVFESFEECRKRLDKLRSGAAISTPTPTTENNARLLVTQGERSHEVRVPRGGITRSCTPIPWLFYT